jgi:mannosyl-3-phosphoglycerate phosphatase
MGFRYRVERMEKRADQSPTKTGRPHLVVFTDLDGTLLDATTYSFEAAKQALDALRVRRVPIVIVSSKTRAEIEPLRFMLDNHDPFIVENGAALYIPQGTFAFPLEQALLRGPYQVMEWGTPYAALRAALKELEQGLGCRVRGFGDMPAEEIAARTGLALSEAHRAKQREYDEPFFFEGSEVEPQTIARWLEKKAITCTRGGRFYHLTGDNDKGRACRVVIDCYRRQLGETLVTAALGDSLNDLPMLAIVDRPILVQKPDGSFDAEVQLPNLTYAPDIGPAGWNQAVLRLIANPGYS